jgi:hypothetical protein
MQFFWIKKPRKNTFFGHRARHNILTIHAKIIRRLRHFPGVALESLTLSYGWSQCLSLGKNFPMSRPKTTRLVLIFEEILVHKKSPQSPNGD